MLKLREVNQSNREEFFNVIVIFSSKLTILKFPLGHS